MGILCSRSEGGWAQLKMEVIKAPSVQFNLFRKTYFLLQVLSYIHISNWCFELTLKSKKVVRIDVNFVFFWHLLTISSRPCCSFGHFNSNRYQSLHKRNVPTIVLSMVQKKKLMTNSSAFSCLEVQLERGNHSVACIWSAIHSKHTSHIKWSTDECVPLLDLDDHGQDLGGPSGAEWIAKYKKVYLGLVIGDTK